jgi:hypothetical protein
MFSKSIERMTDLLRRIKFVVIMLCFISTCLSAENKEKHIVRLETSGCHEVRGRAAYYNGGSWFRIWAVGTHHVYGIEDSVVGERFEPLIKDFDHFVYADFVLCPTTPFKVGSMQGATIESFRHVRVTTRE